MTGTHTPHTTQFTHVEDIHTVFDCVSVCSVGTELRFHLTPSTGDDKEQQYVYLDLQFSLPPSYPHAAPQMTTLQSRGLADTQLLG